MSSVHDDPPVHTSIENAKASAPNPNASVDTRSKVAQRAERIQFGAILFSMLVIGELSDIGYHPRNTLTLLKDGAMGRLVRCYLAFKRFIMYEHPRCHSCMYQHTKQAKYAVVSLIFVFMCLVSLRSCNSTPRSFVNPGWAHGGVHQRLPRPVPRHGQGIILPSLSIITITNNIISVLPLAPPYKSPPSPSCLLDLRFPFLSWDITSPVLDSLSSYVFQPPPFEIPFSSPTTERTRKRIRLLPEAPPVREDACSSRRVRPGSTRGALVGHQVRGDETLVLSLYHILRACNYWLGLARGCLPG
jgi:hypothetical protein